MALQMTLFGAPRGPNSRSKSKPRHLIGKKIILILLTKPMHRETASRRYKRVQIGLGDYSFLPMYPHTGTRTGVTLWQAISSFFDVQSELSSSS